MSNDFSLLSNTSLVIYRRSQETYVLNVKVKKYRLTKIISYRERINLTTYRLIILGLFKSLLLVQKHAYFVQTPRQHNLILS